MMRCAGRSLQTALLVGWLAVIACSSPAPHTSLLTCPALEKLSTSDTLDTMLNKVEELAVQVGREVKVKVANRCSEIQSCPCSRNMCSDSTEGFECSPHVARAGVCGAGGCEASPMDFAATAVHTTSAVNGPLEKEFVCGLTSLDSKLKDAWDQQEGLIWIYFGSFNGVFRSYPGHLWDCARRYDNRIRPWYRGASSGIKDVVVVMDVSGSMSGNQRLQLVKKALNGDAEQKGLLDMLTHNDYVSVVTFSESAETLGSGLQRATIDNVAKLKQAVNGIGVQTTTNFMAGLKSGFDVLTDAAKIERTSGCKQVIVFLTDGEDSFCNSKCNTAPLADIQMQGPQGECRCVDSYLKTISSYQVRAAPHHPLSHSMPCFHGVFFCEGCCVLPELDVGVTVPWCQEELVAITGREASIFTYSMSSDADDNLPRQIACKNGGSWGTRSLVPFLARKRRHGRSSMLCFIPLLS